MCVHQDSTESSCDDQTALYHHVRMSSYVSLLDVSEVCVHQDSAESSCDDQTTLYHHVRMSSYVSLLDVSEVRVVRSPGQCRD